MSTVHCTIYIYTAHKVEIPSSSLLQHSTAVNGHAWHKRTERQYCKYARLPHFSARYVGATLHTWRAMERIDRRWSELFARIAQGCATALPCAHFRDAWDPGARQVLVCVITYYCVLWWRRLHRLCVVASSRRKW